MVCLAELRQAVYDSSSSSSSSSSCHQIFQDLYDCFEGKSFAVIQLSQEEKVLIEEVDHLMIEFFNYQAEDKRSTRKLVPELAGCLSLLGYNQPSTAKEVYRIKRRNYSVSVKTSLQALEKYCPFLSQEQPEQPESKEAQDWLYYKWIQTKSMSQKKKDLNKILKTVTLLEEITLLCLSVLLSSPQLRLQENPLSLSLSLSYL